MFNRDYFIRGTSVQDNEEIAFWRVWRHKSFLQQHSKVINNILKSLESEGKSDINVKEFYLV